MKMIKAVIRPNMVYNVTKALEEEGFFASTKWHVFGRGKQSGIQVGDTIVDEMAKCAIFVVVSDEDKNKVIDIIMDYASTGENSNPGDGKIFVLPVEESYTISERAKDEM